MIGPAELQLERIESIGHSQRVTMTVPSEGSRRVIVTLVGQRVLDVQASQGPELWIGHAGDPDVTRSAIRRAQDEVQRLRWMEPYMQTYR